MFNTIVLDDPTTVFAIGAFFTFLTVAVRKLRPGFLVEIVEALWEIICLIIVPPIRLYKVLLEELGLRKSGGKNRDYRSRILGRVENDEKIVYSVSSAGEEHFQIRKRVSELLLKLATTISKPEASESARDSGTAKPDPFGTIDMLDLLEAESEESSVEQERDTRTN